MYIFTYTLKSVHRSIILEYGIWDQVCVDHGMEWILTLFVQEQLAHLRRNISRPPHLQTSSKQVVTVPNFFRPLDWKDVLTFQNHCVERMWVEINGRVNYPIKACLIEMQERNEINMDSEHVKFCVSWFTIRVSNMGTTLAVQAWNAHPIPGMFSLVI